MDAVHVWRFRLDRGPGPLDELLRLLDGAERARAARLRPPLVRARFIAAHGLLRRLLGRYLNVDPAALRLVTGPHGMPALEDWSGGDTLRFNLSHAAGVALVALARGRAVGVDVERVRAAYPHLAVARRWLLPTEAAWLGSLPPARVPHGFFACWTRQEACLKAEGVGLAGALVGVPTEPRGGAGWRVVQVRDGRLWWVRGLRPQRGYVGALAVAAGAQGDAPPPVFRFAEAVGE